MFFDNYCVTNFNVCASVRVLSSGNHVTMQMWNLNGSLGVAHTLTSIGLYHLGPQNWNGTIQKFTATWSRQDGTTQDVSQYWRPSWNYDIRRLMAESVELSGGTQGTTGGIVGCTDPGGALHFATCTTPAPGQNSFPGNPMLSFDFDLSTPFDIATTAMRWNSQQLPGGGWAKCDIGVGTNPDFDFGPCEHVEDVTVTPEPITIALLGTGFFALGGAGFIRRRRRDSLEQS
jgi:hypothetical protein